MRRLVATALMAPLVLAACADAAPSEPGAADDVQWGEREPVVYSVVVAEVLDDQGAPAPVVYVVNGVCKEAGQVAPGELECAGPIPKQGRLDLALQLERYATVEFVDRPEAALGEDGTVRDGGLLFWLGPLKDRKNGEVRVGATYARRLPGDPLGVNLAMERQAGSWVVTGAAGLGGCPA